MNKDHDMLIFISLGIEFQGLRHDLLGYESLAWA